MRDCDGASLIIKTYREALGGISSSVAGRCAIMRKAIAATLTAESCVQPRGKQLDNQREMLMEKYDDDDDDDNRKSC